MIIRKMIAGLLGFAVMMTASIVAQAAEFVTWRIDDASLVSCSKGGDSWTIVVLGNKVTLDGPTGRLFTIQVTSANGSFTSPQERSPGANRWVFGGNIYTHEYTLKNPQVPCAYRFFPKTAKQQAKQ